MKPMVVVFNMTARSGKDEAVKYLMKDLRVFHPKHLAFKDKLVDTTVKVFGVDRAEWDARYSAKNPDTFAYEWLKDQPWSKLQKPNQSGGFSQREALIHVSENIIKPVFGQGAFGEAVTEELEDGGLYFVSDGGFDEEQEALNQRAHVLYLKRDRLKTNWKGDSRGWISESVGGQHFWIPEEIEDLEEFLQEVRRIVTNWMYLVSRGTYDR